MSRKKLVGGLECRAGKTDTLNKAQLCHLRLQALAVGTLGIQVRAQCMSLSSVQAMAIEKGYRLDEFCSSSKSIEAYSYLGQKEDISDQENG